LHCPFSEEDRNQVLWVDLFVPANAEPGSYSGVISITAADHSTTKLVVELPVRSFALPQIPVMRS